MSAYVALRAGAMTHKITIEHHTGETIDEFGAPVETWVALGDFRAEFVESNTGETIDGNGAVTRTTEVITLRTRWIEGLSASDRIFYDGRRFDIVGLSEIPRRRGWTIKIQHRGL